MAGKLIVFEGTDGSGKSTQFALACQALEQAGARSGMGAYAYASADEAFDAACAALRTLI